MYRCYLITCEKGLEGASREERRLEEGDRGGYSPKTGLSTEEGRLEEGDRGGHSPNTAKNKQKEILFWKVFCHPLSYKLNTETMKGRIL